MMNKDGNYEANGKADGKPYDHEFIAPTNFMGRLLDFDTTMQRCPHCGNMHLTVNRPTIPDDEL